METLLELLPRIERLGSSEALRFWNGYRTFCWSYSDLCAAIRRFAAFLDRRGIGYGDRLVLWSDSRLEWVAVFWACMARGVQLVPLDHGSSPEFVARISSQTSARLLVHAGAPPSAVPAARRFPIGSLDRLPDSARLSRVPVRGTDVAQIVFTSGTTAEPKGVIHLHQNICANLQPIGEEIARYRKWAGPFQPIRILDLLPMSHMFGQSMGIYMPVLLGGAAVFMTGLHPAAIRRTVRRERISVIACVPRILDSLRAEVERRHPRSRAIPTRPGGPARRWWRHRDIHKAFGLKFWAFVVGGAMVNPETEAFWSRVGLLVVQGYGLTETSPVVSVNHPFRARRGTLGEVIAGQEIRVADDGEILVRGRSVVSEYLEAGGRRTSVVDEDGWLHTGDIGEVDEEGRLVYRGRKKDVIVTADGMNVHPKDIERELVSDPEVRDAVVVPVGPASAEKVHAALILDTPGADLTAIVERVNQRLEPHQRIQGASQWPHEEFPRTPSTFKTQRRKVAESLAERAEGGTAGEATGLDQILVALTRRRSQDLTDERRLGEDLGLSSLERIDLLASLEDRYGIELDETDLAGMGTVGEVRAWVSGRPGVSEPHRSRDSAAPRSEVQITPPRWVRSWPVATVRGGLRRLLFLPLFRRYIRSSVSGRSNLEQLVPPVFFAANHSSHLDTVALTAALPTPWQPRLAPAVRQQHFFPTGVTPPLGRRIGMRSLYMLACGLFNAYPLSQDLGQVRDSLRYTGELVEAGYCPLFYPEGRLTPDGSLQRFQPGIGLMAQRLQVPIIPVRMRGLFEVMSMHDSWPRTGSVHVEFGTPIVANEEEDYIQLTARVEEAIRQL